MTNKLKYWALGTIGAILSLFLLAGIAHAIVCNVTAGCTGQGNVPIGTLLVGSSTNQSLLKLATGTQGSVLWMNNNLPSWTATSSLGISATPSAPLNSVQFNNGGAFGGDADFTWATGTSATLSIGDVSSLTAQINLNKDSSANDSVDITGANSNAGSFELFADDTDTNFDILSANGDIYLNTNGDSYITSTGNFGIGTITPTTTLFVQGTAGTNPFSIASSTGTNMLTVLQNGNVGIGTTSPIALFTVASTSNVGLLTVASNGSTTLSSLGTGNLCATSTGLLYISNCGLQTTITNPVTGTGTSGFGAYWNSGTGIAKGKLMDDGTNLGVNATTSTVSFQIQQTGALDPFLISSSTSANYLVVKANGLVGIGSSTPIATLSVQGTSTLPTTDVLQVASSSDASLLVVKANGNVGIGSSSPAALLSVQGTSGSTTDLLNVASSTHASLLVVKSSGNVGIGTIAPSGMLTIYDAGNTRDDQLKLGYTDSFNYIIGRNHTTGYLDFTGNQATNSGFHFATPAGTLMTILNGGNVGIGTTTPSVPLTINTSNTTALQIYGTGAFSTMQIIATGADSGLYLNNLSTNGRSYLIDSVGAGSGVASAGNLVIWDNTASRVDLTISSGGNVGIGTTTPSYSFVVKGTIQQASSTNCSNGILTDVNGVFNGCVASDISLKKDIKDMPLNPSLFDKIKGKLWFWKDPNRGVGQVGGFVAQFVKPYFPDCINGGGKNLLGVDSNCMTAHLWDFTVTLNAKVTTIVTRLDGQDKKITAQQKQIDQQAKSIQALQQEIIQLQLKVK